MMKSCERCGKTIITDEKEKVLVGCEHYRIIEDGFGDFPEGFESIFGNLKK